MSLFNIITTQEITTQEQKERILQTYHDLHAIPEPPFKEERTATYLAGRLAAAGFQVTSRLGGGTGLTGTMGRPRSPVLAFRADMDALGHEIDQKAVFIHSCGHDANMTMVLCAAEIIKNTIPTLIDHFKVLFQPAEEIIQGAPAMVKSGAVDDVDTLLAIHLRPQAETPRGAATPNLVHSSSNTLNFQVKGRAAHSGRPHQGCNAADALAAMVGALNAIKTNPLQCATVNVVALKAGGPSANVIPESGELTVNIRAEDNELAAQLRERVTQTVRTVAAVYGVTVVETGLRTAPAGNHDPETIRLARDGIERVLGPEGVVERIVTAGGEDFCFYPLLKPGLKTAYIGLGSDLTPGLHHPEASFNPEVLVTGTEILVRIAAEYAGRSIAT